MYYRNANANRYSVMLAPAGPVDTIPPTVPVNLTAVVASDSQIDLSWETAEDTETGIAQYKVFRDGEIVATIKGLEFSDTGLDEATEYTYTLSAVNYHGVEGPKSMPVATTTLKRTEPSHTHYLPCLRAAMWQVSPASRAAQINQLKGLARIERCAPHSWDSMPISSIIGGMVS
jgi:hypothetical protein